MSSVTHLPVSALGTGATRIEELVRATNNRELIQSSQFMNLETRNRLFSGGYNKLDASLYTREVASADKRRDSCLTALYTRAKSELYTPLRELQQAAQRIYRVLKAHGNATSISTLPLGEESKVVAKLLTNLRVQELQADLVALNLGAWIDALSNAQGEFEAIYARRSDENATAGDIASATTQRRDLESAIRSFIKYVNAMATVSTDPMWHDLSIKIEERLDELAHGSRTASRTKPESKG